MDVLESVLNAKHILAASSAINVREGGHTAVASGSAGAPVAFVARLSIVSKASDARVTGGKFGARLCASSAQKAEKEENDQETGGVAAAHGSRACVNCCRARPKRVLCCVCVRCCEHEL